MGTFPYVSERQKRLLVVEDDEPTQRLIAALMQRRGYLVLVARNGEEALSMIESPGDFDCVILDLMMPEVSGRDVVERLATVPDAPSVVICSAAGPRQLENFNEDVVKAVLRKPFDIDEFVSVIERIAGPATPPPPKRTKVLVVDDDSSTRYVMREFVDADVYEARDAAEAIETIRDTRPDLMFVDLILPGTPGEELIRYLRDDPGTAKIPIVIITSRVLSDSERMELLRYSASIIDKRDLSRDVLGGAMRLVLGSGS